MFCGDDFVDWDDFVKVCKINSPCTSHPGFERMLQIAQTREEYHYRLRLTKAEPWKTMERLQQLLLRHHDSSSTIPHDMIYALRGLAGLSTMYEEHQRFIERIMSPGFLFPIVIDFYDLLEQVDYKKTMGEVYAKVAAEIFTEYESLSLLSACAWPRQSADLPSWAPDWSTPGAHSHLSQRLRQSASIGSRYGISASAEWTKCDVKFYDEDGDAVETYDLELAHYSSASGFIFDVLKDVTTPPGNLGMEISTMFQLLGSEHWKVTTTTSGTMCIIPIQAQTGDELGLFHGGETPLLLRKCYEGLDLANEKKHQVTICKLVGECYVGGVMQGSMFDISRCTTFWIS
ncbi:hypothetical protein BT63DRAFT_454348 [Microthyrium microscopicum]|uniref:Heterokaryon incompatibility domain-containing protein n=1 Tax=Microthyrium microscopicum TaxID=703497 RepID=A0A6A6UEV5_9PEZI|nr:hypothetical protein BT63DRAFT_454348 [Microthyrium microscopicum]